MLERQRKVQELYYLEHKHDRDPDRGHDYEQDLLTRSVSPVLLRNSLTRWFIERLQSMMVVMVDSTQELRNLFNYNVERYYNGHNR